MKAYLPLINGVIFASVFSAPPLFATDASMPETQTTAEQAESIKMLVFTAGASLADGYKTFRTSGGTGNIVYSLYDEKGEKEVQLPADLSFGQDGVIRGTVPMAGFNPNMVTYTIKAFDEGGGGASKKVGFKINPPLNVEIEAIRLTAGGSPTNPIYPFKISGGTGKTEITFIDRNGVPAKAPGGLVFGRTGGITGKVPQDASELQGMQARVTDEGGGVVTKDIKWIVNPPMTATTVNPEVTAGGAIPAGLIPVKITGGTPDVKLAIYERDGVSPAVLPEGVEFNEVNGSLAGKVKSFEQANAYPIEKVYVVKAADQGGGSLESKFTLKINKFLQLSELN